MAHLSEFNSRPGSLESSWPGFGASPDVLHLGNLHAALGPARIFFKINCTASSVKSSEMSRAPIIVRTVFALCLLVATFNHVRAILLHGVLWDYGFGKDLFLASKLYWALLTIFDPLAALLLYWRPRAGVRLTLAIIVSDVVHNTYYVAMRHQWLELFYLGQVAFLVFVVGFARVAARPPAVDRSAKA